MLVFAGKNTKISACRAIQWVCNQFKIPLFVYGRILNPTAGLLLVNRENNPTRIIAPHLHFNGMMTLTRIGYYFVVRRTIGKIPCRQCHQSRDGNGAFRREKTRRSRSRSGAERVGVRSGLLSSVKSRSQDAGEIQAGVRFASRHLINRLQNWRQYRQQ